MLIAPEVLNDDLCPVTDFPAQLPWPAHALGPESMETSEKVEDLGPLPAGDCFPIRKH